jgi:hypothetical protein
MRLSKDGLSLLYQTVTARPPGGSADCLSEELIVRASCGVVSPQEREALARHLPMCSDCAQEYRLLTELPGRVRDGREIPRSAQGWWPQKLVLAAAACLVLAAAGLSVWVSGLYRENRRLSATVAAGHRAVRDAGRQLSQDAVQLAELRGEIASLEQPRLNTPVIDLDAAGPIRGASAPSRTLEIPPSADLFTLILNLPPGTPSYPNYSLEIVDRNGAVIWSGNGLRRSAFDTFDVTLTRKLLPPGGYRLRLYGVQTIRKALVAYGITIR